MCGSHASRCSSVSSHPTYGPAKAVGRSQTRPVERKIMALSSLLNYENVGSKQIIYSKIV